MLGAYDESGAELSYAALRETADRLGWRTAMRHGYKSLSQLMAEANDLPADAEGFVVRFDDGMRLKIKGAEYRRIHALVSRITPLAMWEIMQAGDDLAKIRRDIPEEFWTDFDAICGILTRKVEEVVEAAERAAASVAHLSDKEVGLRLNEFPSRHPRDDLHPSQAKGWPTVRPVAPGDLSLGPADGQRTAGICAVLRHNSPAGRVHLAQPRPDLEQQTSHSKNALWASAIDPHRIFQLLRTAVAHLHGRAAPGCDLNATCSRRMRARACARCAGIPPRRRARR